MENIFFDTGKLKSKGANVIIGKTVRMRKPELSTIGRNSIIDDFTYIPCELHVGKYSHVGSGTIFIGGPGKVTIGSFVNIAPGCKIVTGSNDYRGGGLVGPGVPAQFAGESVIKPVEIGDHVLLGVNTVVLEGAVLPEGLATGAFTLLKGGVAYKPWTLYVGSPAREIGPRDGTEMKRQAKLVLEAEKDA